MSSPNQDHLPDVSGDTDRGKEIAFREWLEEVYRSGAPPWDSGIPAPELTELIEGPDPLPPGRALDLGCGTGTNSVYLARNGWEVVGVDMVDLAVHQARAKAGEAGVSATFVHGDVTRMEDLPVAGPFTLLFDLSCYCGIPHHRRDGYAAGATRLAAPDARLLMFGYGYGVLDESESGVTEEELRARFTDWRLTATVPGTNPFPTFWFTLER